jgi:hypothetical protein
LRMDHPRQTVDDRHRIDRKRRPPLIDKRVVEGGLQREPEDDVRTSDPPD